MRVFKYLLIVAVALVGISFAWLNAQPVVLHYYAGTAQIRLSLLLILFLLLGWLLGLASMLYPYVALRRRLFTTSRRLKVAEKEVGNLRSLPIKDAD